MVDDLQKLIRNYIEDCLGIIPYQVIYTQLQKGIIHLSFGSGKDYSEFKKKQKLESRCDKTGIYEYPETYTLLFKDSALIDFLGNVKDAS